MVHQPAGGEPEKDHERYGLKPLKLIYSQPTWAFTRHGIVSRIALFAMNSCRQVCFILRHATDDNNDNVMHKMQISATYEINQFFVKIIYLDWKFIKVSE